MPLKSIGIITEGVSGSWVLPSLSTATVGAPPPPSYKLDSSSSLALYSSDSTIIPSAARHFLLRDSILHLRVWASKGVIFFSSASASSIVSIRDLRSFFMKVCSFLKLAGFEKILDYSRTFCIKAGRSSVKHSGKFIISCTAVWLLSISYWL